MEKATRCLPHLENKHQGSVKDFCSCNFRNISGTWPEASRTKNIGAFTGKYVLDISVASSWTVTIYFIHRATIKCFSAFWPTNTVKRTYIDNNDHFALGLTMMQGQQLLTLHWCSFWRWGRENVTFSFSYKGGQYFVSACLQRVAT